MTAAQLLVALLDAGTYASWDSAPTDMRPAPGYAGELARARAATGLDESVCTGEGLLGGRRVAVVVSEFGFLGGSIGVAAAERITLAVERATAERLPLIAAPASGGTRMQEGAVAFLQMVKITAAVAAHRAAGLPYLVYLRHPTTGGVFASWASVGHVTVAEPGALIGFLGPRVYEALTGAPIPDRVQTAESLLAHGLVDAVIPPDELAGYLARVLTITAPPSLPATALSPAPGSAPVPARPGTSVGDARTSGWESVMITRRPDRPGAADLIRATATDVVPLSEGGLILALARVGGHPCVLAAQDRKTLPHGLEMLRTAQLPADRFLAAQHAWLSPLAPEGASEIVYRDTAHAPELADRQGIRSADLAAAGIVDRIVAETSADQLIRDLGRLLAAEIDSLAASDDVARLSRRQRKYRHLGTRLGRQ